MTDRPLDDKELDALLRRADQAMQETISGLADSDAGLAEVKREALRRATQRPRAVGDPGRPEASHERTYPRRAGGEHSETPVLLALLTDKIAALGPGRTLTIAEFQSAEIIVWRVSPDSAGTPRVAYYSRPWDSLRDWGTLSEAALFDHIRPGDDSRMMVARTGTDLAGPATSARTDADHAFTVTRVRYPHAQAFNSTASVDELLNEATANVPLPASTWYELVLLRSHRSGRIELTAQPLFPPGARRGDTSAFTVRCEPSDEHGTAFVVAARGADLQYELLSMKSARIQPGTYWITATLLRPGQVRFDGLPAKLLDDPRTWNDILAAVPQWPDVSGAAPQYLPLPFALNEPV